MLCWDALFTMKRICESWPTKGPIISSTDEWAALDFSQVAFELIREQVLSDCEEQLKVPFTNAFHVTKGQYDSNWLSYLRFIESKVGKLKFGRPMAQSDMVHQALELHILMKFESPWSRSQGSIGFR